MTHLEEKGILPERIRLSQGGSFETLLEDGQPADLERRERVEVRLLNEVVPVLIPPPGGQPQPPEAHAAGSDAAHGEEDSHGEKGSHGESSGDAPATPVADHQAGNRHAGSPGEHAAANENAAEAAHAK